MNRTPQVRTARPLDAGGVELMPWNPAISDAIPASDYPAVVSAMDQLLLRSADEDDLLLVVQHPPTLTVGRKGGLDHIHDTRWQPTGERVPIHEVARGGSVTWHAPGQLVIYPVVQLARQAGPWGRGPLGDLPAFVRLLEREIQATCAHFGVATLTIAGQSGVFLDPQRKLASLGLGMRHGWTFHGLALNVAPRLDGFAMTPCGLHGVRMASMQQACLQAGVPEPSLPLVARDLVARLQQVLVRHIDEKAPAPKNQET